jgi:hypothetical protein
LALSNAVLSLKSNWQLCPYFDREYGIRVCYVEGWYSLFFTVDESAWRIIVIAILGQAEDLNLPYKQVKAILLKRTSANRLKLLNQDSSCRLKNLSTESDTQMNMFAYEI